MTNLNAKYSNTKVKSRNDNISEWFATEFTGVTLVAPSNFAPSPGTPASQHVANGGTVPNYLSYVCDNLITGTDSETGYGPPTGDPLKATVLYGVYVIDYYRGFATNDRAGVDIVAPISFEDVVINGEFTKALVLTQTEVPQATFDDAGHSGGFRQQLWYTFYRNVITGNDLPVASFSGFIWVNDLSDKYYIPAVGFIGAKNRTTFIDWKSGTSANGGDYRVSIAFIAATDLEVSEYGATKGQIGLEIILDNQGNATPDLTPKHDEYVRFKNFSVAIPQEEFFEFDFDFKRGSSVSDTTTGRFVFRIKPKGQDHWAVVCDLTASSIAQFNIDHPSEALFPSAQDCRMITMGSRGDKMQRLFCGQYSNRYNKQFTVKFAKIKFHSGLRD